MKQNYKIKIVLLGCIVFGLGFYGHVSATTTNPNSLNNLNTTVNLQTVSGSIDPSDVPCGRNCEDTQSCIQTNTGSYDCVDDGDKLCGQNCNDNAGCIKTDEGIYGCVDDTDVACGHTCADGYSCIGVTCVSDTGTGTGSGAGQNNPSPTSPTPPTAPTGQSTTMTCPAGMTAPNGICLPPSEYSSGIAASTSLSGFIFTLIKILLSFAGLIAVVMLVLGGYWYMAAGGNEEMAEKGRKTIINFVLGLVVIILAYTLVSIIASTLTGADPLVPK